MTTDEKLEELAFLHRRMNKLKEEVLMEQSIGDMNRMIAVNLQFHTGPDHLTILQHVKKVNPQFDLNEFNARTK